MTALSTFDQRQLRDVFGTFVTGVTVVTTRDAAGNAHGVTANSFSSVSIDPPLVLWSQALTSKSYPGFRDTEHFVVNILADDQVAVSNRFAKSGDDKFDGIACSIGIGGAPILEGTAAHLECAKVAAYPSGDHVVYIGRVERIGQTHRRPLAFGSGRYMVAYSHDLGPVALRVGEKIADQVEAVKVVSAAMPEIAEQLGQHTLCLSVWGNHGPTAVRWEPSRQPVSDQLRVGLVMPITRSATGKAFAAFLPTATTKAFIDEDLRIFRQADEDEASQRRTFDEQIEAVRQRGMARASNPGRSPMHRVEVNAFSAPIFDANGTMVCALSLTSKAERLKPDWDGPVPVGLARSAGELSKQLGFGGGDSPKPQANP